MRKSVTIALLPAIALGGCTLLGGGRSADSRVVAVKRNAPLVIPKDFTLPPPRQQAAAAQAR